MAIVVGLRPGQRNTAALRLAAELAEALEESVIAASVTVVAPGVPSPLRIGMTDEAFAAQLAADAMVEAREILGDALLDQFPVIARSVRAGLLEVVAQEGSRHLVLGSAAGGRPGAVNLGDTAHAILTSASVPVHFAPQGYSGGDPAHPVRRLNVAFGADDASRVGLQFGAELAHRIDGMLRTVTFWVRQPSGASPMGGLAYGSELSAQWHEQMIEIVDRAIRGLADLQLPTMWIDKVFGDGIDWEGAMEDVPWEAGDLLIVGSRPRGGLGGVFLGSRAAEILRHSTVPTVVLPG
ncbi:MAG: universal stress protein [Solirubrobacteraceae bacterium]|nr:universal stress protein [Solirubrobacteraceae bacterium]